MGKTVRNYNGDGFKKIKNKKSKKSNKVRNARNVRVDDFYDDDDYDAHQSDND